MKTLYVVSLGVWLMCAGCGQNTAILSSAEPAAQTTAGQGRQDGQPKPTTDGKESPGEDTDEPAVIVYYFHRTIRCIACITVESIAAETIEEAFGEQLANGRLIWMRINLDDEGSRQYEQQFDVSGSTLVVAKVNDRNQMQYKKLSKVWELLSKPQDLSEHIEGEIKGYLNQ